MAITKELTYKIRLKGDVTQAKELEKFLSRYATKWSKFGNTIEATFKRKTADSIENVKSKARGLVKEFSVANLYSSFKRGTKPVEEFTEQFTIAKKQVKETKKELNKFKFQGQYLSIMFFGMAIRRTFGNILRSGLNTFQQIMMATDELIRVTNPAYQAINALGSQFDYLKFSVGQAVGTALRPLIPVIIKITDWFSRLINKHPKLFTYTIGLIALFGGLLAIGGTLKLGIQGLVWTLRGLAIRLGIVKVGGEAAARGLTVASGATTVFSGALGILKTTLKIGIIGAIIAVGVWLYKFSQKVGGLKELMKSFARGVIRLWDVIYSFTVAIAESIKNVFAKAMNWVIDKINKVIKWSNRVLHTHFKPIKMKFEVEKMNYSFADRFWNEFEKITDWSEKRFKEIGWSQDKGYLEKGHWWNPSSWVLSEKNSNKATVIQTEPFDYSKMSIAPELIPKESGSQPSTQTQPQIINNFNINPIVDTATSVADQTMTGIEEVLIKHGIITGMNQ